MRLCESRVLGFSLNQVAVAAAVENYKTGGDMSALKIIVPCPGARDPTRSVGYCCPGSPARTLRLTTFSW